MWEEFHSIEYSQDPRTDIVEQDQTKWDVLALMNCLKITMIKLQSFYTTA